MVSTSTEEPVIFGSAAEALRNGLRDALTPPLLEETKRAGIDFQNLHAAYHTDTWVAVLRIIARHLAPSLPENEQYVELGRRFMQGFVKTGVGVAALAISRVIGVRRTLQRMGRNFKQAANYIEIEVTDAGPNEVIIRAYTQPRFLPKTADRSNLISDYRKGVIDQILKLIGVEGTVELTNVAFELQDFTYRVRWK